MKFLSIFIFLFIQAQYGLAMRSNAPRNTITSATQEEGAVTIEQHRQNFKKRKFLVFDGADNTSENSMSEVAFTNTNNNSNDLVMQESQQVYANNDNINAEGNFSIISERAESKAPSKRDAFSKLVQRDYELFGNRIVLKGQGIFFTRKPAEDIFSEKNMTRLYKMPGEENMEEDELGEEMIECGDENAYTDDRGEEDEEDDYGLKELCTQLSDLLSNPEYEAISLSGNRSAYLEEDEFRIKKEQLLKKIEESIESGNHDEADILRNEYDDLVQLK